jgi:hypothetical protein
MVAAADIVPGISIVVDDLVRVRGLLSEISASRIRRLASLHSGAREVRLHGRGMDYEESRAYVYGDDFRTMDWRVMARTGDPHTKVFAEEKERRSLLAIDLSPSMYFGTRYSFKSWAAAQVAAHAGWLANSPTRRARDCSEFFTICLARTSRGWQDHPLPAASIFYWANSIASPNPGPASPSFPIFWASMNRACSFCRLFPAITRSSVTGFTMIANFRNGPWEIILC